MAQFFQINKLSVDQYGHPAIVNAIGSLDVDIIIDEGPDAVNLQADSMMVLQSLGPQFAQQFPEIALELSSLPQSVKKPMLDKIKAMQNAPPKPDPKVMALQAQFQIDQQAAQADLQRKEQEHQMDQAAQAATTNADIEAARVKAAADIEIARIKAAADIQLKRENADVDMEIAHRKAAQQRDHVQASEDRNVDNEKSVAKAKMGGDVLDSVNEAMTRLGEGFDNLANAVKAPRKLVRDQMGRADGSVVQADA